MILIYYKRYRSSTTEDFLRRSRCSRPFSSAGKPLSRGRKAFLDKYKKTINTNKNSFAYFFQVSASRLTFALSRLLVVSLRRISIDDLRKTHVIQDIQQFILVRFRMTRLSPNRSPKTRLNFCRCFMSSLLAASFTSRRFLTVYQSVSSSWRKSETSRAHSTASTSGIASSSSSRKTLPKCGL